MTNATYRVIVSRENDAWLATVPAVPGTHTWAKSLVGLNTAVREAIALGEDLPDGAEPTLTLRYEYNTGDPSLDAKAAALREMRERVEREASDLAERTNAAARELREHGLSVRDTGALLDVSPQRVSQVAPGEKQQHRRVGRRQKIDA